MAITGKQVRQLRSMANNLKPTVIVGKEGVTANILKQVNEGLEAHELIKVSVLCETGSQAAEAGREIADQAEAELVQVIGKRVVLYRETTRDDIYKSQLVKYPGDQRASRLATGVARLSGAPSRAGPGKRRGPISFKGGGATRLRRPQSVTRPATAYRPRSGVVPPLWERAMRKTVGFGRWRSKRTVFRGLVSEKWTILPVVRVWGFR